VDDIADEEGMPADERNRRLQVWREEVDRIYTGNPDHPIARALVAPTRRFDLQRADYLAVIDGMAMDTETTLIRPDMETLDLYIDRVACAVGRLSVRIFGPYTPECDDVAAALGRALQLTNILRDVAEDASLGRLYLPDELLSSYGIKGTDPAEVMAHPLVVLVLRDIAVMARRYFGEAAQAMAKCPKPTMRPAALMRASYYGILVRLEKKGWHSLDERVSLSPLQKLWYAVRFTLLWR
jgi:phytoene synthase